MKLMMIVGPNVRHREPLKIKVTDIFYSDCEFELNHSDMINKGRGLDGYGSFTSPRDLILINKDQTVVCNEHFKAFSHLLTFVNF